MEHHRPRIRDLRLPVLPARDRSGHPADAGGTRVRRGSTRSSRAVTAIPELCLAFFAAHLLNKGLDSRLLMASGFAVMASVCLLNASLTSVWTAENYFRTELLMAV